MVESRFTARLAATREQVLEAESDLVFQGEVMGIEFRDVVRGESGAPLTWVQVARNGPFRQTYAGTSVSSDPLVMVSRRRGVFTEEQTSTTTVDDAPGEDGRIGVEWLLRVEATGRYPFSGCLLALTGSSVQRRVSRIHAGMTMQWAAAIESRALREPA
ncbi:hypothetical protein [Demequina salsinemoris]|uniref:hypothetical protein n=1 Tax=Demequina salsinemoris TaxID=577470 RepID=UPI0007820EAD|nr:hypothetical protein [Demequina salsinemoris]